MKSITTQPLMSDDPTARLLSVPKFGSGVGLHRMTYFLKEVCDPTWLQNLDAIKVTGSKGKGSVSALIATMLGHLGIRTGLYTSPHLIHFNERIQINGQPITQLELSAAVDLVLDVRSRYETQFKSDHVGAFEVFTATALNHFSTQRVETMVSEAGIGGRYDSTRLIPGQIVALTSVELEHTNLLGNSTELIAYDKADLCPSRGTLVTGQLEDDVARRLTAYCAVRDVALIPISLFVSISGLTYRSDLMCFDIQCEDFRFNSLETPLLGEHQARNIGLSVLAARRWLSRNRPDVTRDAFESAVRRSVATVQWPGRLQRISHSPDIFIDVGHTPHSMRSIAKTIREAFPEKPILLLTGVSEDKDITGVLRELVPIAAEIICTRAHHKGAPSSTIAECCEQLRPGYVYRALDSIESAFDIAKEQALAKGMTVLVAGGLFLAIEALVYSRGEDPKSLRFF